MTRHLIIPSLVCAFVFGALPTCASAAWWSYSTVSGDGSQSTSVNSYSSASASTGGNTVSGNGSVTTGDSSASVHSTTIVGGNDAGGSVDVQIETVTNGATSSQSIHKNLAPGEGASINISTSTTSGGSQVGATIEVQAGDGENAASGTPLEIPAVEEISRSWFSGFLGRFARWFSFF